MRGAESAGRPSATLHCTASMPPLPATKQQSTRFFSGFSQIQLDLSYSDLEGNWTLFHIDAEFPVSGLPDDAG